MSSLNRRTVVDLCHSRSDGSRRPIGNDNRKVIRRSVIVHSKTGRVAGSRKRNRQGEHLRTGNRLFARDGMEVAETSNTSSEQSQIQVIDVEQVKENAYVDLTKDLRNDVYVDLTTSPDLEGSSNSIALNDKNNDEIMIVSHDAESIISGPGDNIMTCAICMDDFNQIKKAKRQLTSTTCGHVFCTPCITSSLHTQAKCPTCRKKINKKQLHPIFL